MSKVFDDLFKDIAGFGDAELVMVKQAGLKRFVHFGTINAATFETELKAVGLCTGEVHEVLTLQKFYYKWLAMPKGKNALEAELTQDVWLEFLADIAQQNATAGVTKTMTVPTAAAPNVAAGAPTVAASTSVRTVVDNTFAQHKWDAKSVPTLPKNKLIFDAFE
jgi:hypothetical protein